MFQENHLRESRPMLVLNNKQYIMKLQQRTRIGKDSSNKYINTDVLACKVPRSFPKALKYGEFFAENPVLCLFWLLLNSQPIWVPGEIRKLPPQTLAQKSLTKRVVFVSLLD